MGLSSAPLAIQIAWLERLRWASIAAQVAIVSGVHFALELPLPLGWLALLVALQVLLNLGSAAVRGRGALAGPQHVAALLALDLLLFTGVLYFTGGTSNPFSALYLVYIALAALFLPRRLGLALVVLSSACFAALFVDHVSLPFEDGHHHEELGWYQRGTWLALGGAALLTVQLMSRALRELRQLEAELERERRERARRERLASLATLAAGAAHELSSPLSTIAVAAGELEQELRRHGGLPDAVEDAALIRAQVERCRAVLEQLAADAGQPPAAALEEVALRELVEQACRGAGPRERIQLLLPERAARARLPVKSLARALRGVIQNALEAAPGRPVTVSCESAERELRLRVSDPGAGMSAEVLKRAGEPFFTTKGDRGMGLGLFLAHSVAEELGGRLEISSELGKGTQVTLRLPLLPAA